MQSGALFQFINKGTEKKKKNYRARGEGGGLHMKGAGMLVVSLWGVNLT